MRQGRGLCHHGEVPGQERRLGDLNPGWARTQTALAVPSVLRKPREACGADHNPRRSARVVSAKATDAAAARRNASWAISGPITDPPTARDAARRSLVSGPV